MTDPHSDLRLAAEGGAPVRAARLPYGRQQID